jgi:hypothetical protein
MRVISKATSWRVGSGVLGLLALLLALGVTAAEPQGTAAKVESPDTFCELSSAADVMKRLGEAPPARGVKLVVSKEEVKPGEKVMARLVNFDEKVVLFGAEFKIQRSGSTGWELDSSSPNGPWKMSRGRIQPDEAGGCYRFAVPADQDSGRYRFFTKVRSGSKQLGKTGEFNVQ